MHSLLKKYGRFVVLSLVGLILSAAYIIYDYKIYGDVVILHLLSPPYFYEMFFHLLMIVIVPAFFMFVGYQDLTKKRLINQLQELTEKWKKTYDSIPDLIFVLDNKHHIIDANRATINRWGKDIIGKQFCYMYLAHKCIPHKNCPHDRCVASKETVKGELSSEIPYEVTCSPIIDSDSRIIGSVHVVKDISEKKKAEEEKRNLEAQLFQAQKMESIGRFAGGIAHDFNNMLTAILGYSELIMQSTGDGAPFKKDIKQIKSVAEKAASLTKSILTFSRKKVERPSPIDINKTIRNVETLLERIMGKDVGLKINLWPDEIAVNADEGQLEQVLMNLASNARDAMPDGGTLKIESTQVDVDEKKAERILGISKGKYVLVTVSDTGSGMDREVMERIFEPFYTTKELGRGTGLGLSICYSIINQHGGHIDMQSERLKGTTFEIYLPLLIETSKV
jgi:PAS domain S-box-containing protein